MSRAVNGKQASTILGIPDRPAERGVLSRAKIWLAALALVLLVAASSQTRANVTSSSGPWRVSVEYAKVVTAGQPAPLEVTLSSDARITTPVVLHLCATWFDAMDFQNWYPNPASETRSGDTIEYEFDPPDAQTFRVALDARAAPGQFGAVLPCDLTIAAGGEPVLETSLTTWRLP